MAIARTTGAFLGTDESTGVTLTNNSTSSSSEVDVLGDNTSVGDVKVYLCATSTVAVGTLDVSIFPQRVTGAGYTRPTAQISVVPINGTEKYYLGTFQASRYMTGFVKNNATGASATNVSLLYELFKMS